MTSIVLDVIWGITCLCPARSVGSFKISSGVSHTNSPSSDFGFNSLRHSRQRADENEILDRGLLNRHFL